MSRDDFEEAPILYTGPPLSLAAPCPPFTPILSALIASIINSSDRLFFIAYSLGNPTTRKWHLVRIAFADSTALYPSCLQDGQFLVEFYTLHHTDVRFNAINQRYWLQYNSINNISTPSPSTATHLIRLSDTSEPHASRLWLVLFRRWINLTHSDTLLHGLFEFATVHGRKTRDCISQSDWDILSCYHMAFNNPIPQFDLPSYSIHVDQGTHIAICDTLNNDALCAALDTDNEWLYP
jgi:hypothetical protein